MLTLHIMYCYATEIYRKTKDGERPYFRPLLLDPVDDDDACSEDVANMIKKCWSEDPTDRPDFHALKGIIRKFNKYVVFCTGKTNVFKSHN